MNNNDFLERIIEELIIGDTWMEDKNKNKEEVGTCISDKISLFKTKDNTYRLVRISDEGSYKEFILTKDEMLDFIHAIVDAICYLEDIGAWK